MLLDLFYPPHCSVCEKYIENRRDILCDECTDNILAIEKYHHNVPPLKEVWRLTKYKSGTKPLIRDLKFNKRLNTLIVINKILNKALISNTELSKLLNKIDIATIVPLHKEREAKRGFNQVELIFNDWLSQQNIPIERLLLRIRSTEHLYKFKSSKEKRMKEIIGAFALEEDAVDKIKGKRILILDDIFTTGTTMSECAKILEISGASCIYGLALASNFYKPRMSKNA